MAQSAGTGRRWIRPVLTVYLLLTAAIGFWPTPVDAGVDGAVNGVLRLFAAHGFGFIDYPVVEFCANILFFVPLGFLIAGLLGRRWWLSPVVCLLGSVAIEIGQLLFLASRFSSLGDVISNTTGGVLGTLIALLVFRRPRLHSSS